MEKIAGIKKVRLENGTYQVEFWHNDIAFERAIYPNENINDHRPLERKIYENGKLYSEAYFSYEKNEELNIVYGENGDKKIKVVANFNEGIRIIDNYFEGTEQVNKREYLEMNSYELEKLEIFNREGELIEVSNWDEGELLFTKKYSEIINEIPKVERADNKKRGVEYMDNKIYDNESTKKENLQKIIEVNSKMRETRITILNDKNQKKCEKITTFLDEQGRYRVFEFDLDNNVKRHQIYKNNILESEILMDGKNLITKNYDEKGNLKESKLENYLKKEQLVQKYENNILKSQDLNFGERTMLIGINGKRHINYKKAYSRTLDENGKIVNESYGILAKTQNFFKNIKNKFEKEKRGETIGAVVEKYSKNINEYMEFKTIEDYKELNYEKHCHKNGETTKEIYYSPDRIKELNYENGKLEEIIEKNYSEKTLRGYYENNNLKLEKNFTEKDHIDDDYYADVKLYYKTGQLKYEEKEGEKNSYYEDGILKQEIKSKEINGKMRVAEKNYSETGQLNLEIYQNEEKNTKLSREYYESGKWKEMNIQEGNVQKKETYYEEGGIHSQEISKKNGNEFIVENEKVYYKNGILKQETQYEEFPWIEPNGVYEELKVGLPIKEKYYDELGVLIREVSNEYTDKGPSYGIVYGIDKSEAIDYKNGHETKKSIYDENGNLSHEINYEKFLNNEHKEKVLPVNEKKYKETGEIISEKINSYQEFQLKNSIEIDYKNGVKIKENIKEYDNCGKVIKEKINSYEIKNKQEISNGKTRERITREKQRGNEK
ncbi:toxin-antitoxin system YwqK family antitoxin [Cetobacterium somerae]